MGLLKSCVLNESALSVWNINFAGTKAERIKAASDDEGAANAGLEGLGSLSHLFVMDLLVSARSNGRRLERHRSDGGSGV